MVLRYSLVDSVVVSVGIIDKSHSFIAKYDSLQLHHYPFRLWRFS